MTSAAGSYYRERGKHSMDLAKRLPAQRQSYKAAASVWLRLADEFDAQDPPARARRPLASTMLRKIVEPLSGTAARRRQNLEAMKSPASIALGVLALALVVLVSLFYDHPALETPSAITALHTHTLASLVSRIEDISAGWPASRHI
jgi:hypothetical protein